MAPTEEYEVEQILQQRNRKGREEDLIKWKVYGEKSNSWEPAENLQNCPEKLPNEPYACIFVPKCGGTNFALNVHINFCT